MCTRGLCEDLTESRKLTTRVPYHAKHGSRTKQLNETEAQFDGKLESIGITVGVPQLQTRAFNQSEICHTPGVVTAGIRQM